MNSAIRMLQIQVVSTPLLFRTVPEGLRVDDSDRASALL
jgi:hypothetical protein